MQRCILTAALVAALAGALSVPVAGLAGSQPAPRPEPLSLDEARRTVRVMNDIYITGVLTTHKMYVQEPGTAAAVTWGKLVIREVNAKGGPKARIFAATDRPLNPENLPADSFEREAGAAFVKGRDHFEKIAGGHYRYAVPIRATDRSCLSCHVRNKEGDLLGGVSYDALLKTSARSR